MHDNNPETTIVSFFSGYGGLEIGITAALGGNTRLLACVERDAFPVANLVAKMEQGLMDAAPIFTDVLSFPYREFRGLVDIACGGVPCQPHSHAGKRKGGSDERFLFDDFCDGMAEMRPGLILIENVQGLLTSKMPDGSLCIRHVLNKLESIGYCVESHTGKPLIGIFSASEVGAPHQRKRVFILAYDKSDGRGTWRTESGIWEWVNGPVGVGSEELALRHGVGCPHGEPQEQPAEAGLDAQRNPAAGGGENVAHRTDSRRGKNSVPSELWPGLPIQSPGDGGFAAKGKGCQVGEGMADGGSERLQEYHQQPGTQRVPVGAYKGEDLAGVCEERAVWPSRPGEQQYAWEPPRVVGAPGRMDDPQGFGPEPRSIDNGQVTGDGNKPLLPDTTRGSMAHPVHDGVQRGTGQPGGNDRGGQNGEAPIPSGGRTDRSADYGEIKSALGRDVDGTASGLDFPQCTGLSDTELEEIYGWMVKGTNRTDELRLCGNGVVSQTAEKAWRVLYAELCAGESNNNQVSADESKRDSPLNAPCDNGKTFRQETLNLGICPPQERDKNGQQNRESGDNRPGESRAGTPSSLSSAESLRVVRGSVHAAQDKAQEGEGVLPGVQQQSAGEVGVENQEKEIDKPSVCSLPNCSGDLPGQMGLFEEIK